jgi:hypothetical protein
MILLAHTFGPMHVTTTSVGGNRNRYLTVVLLNGDAWDAAVSNGQDEATITHARYALMAQAFAPILAEVAKPEVFA